MPQHRCADCGSTQIIADRSLNGRLTCSACGSFRIGWNKSYRLNRTPRWLPTAISRVRPEDWQYLIPTLILAFFFIATDVIPVLNKTDLMFWAPVIPIEPYRLVTSAVIHSNAFHLLSNLAGIAVARYMLMQMDCRSRILFALLIGTLAIAAPLLAWIVQIFVIQSAGSPSLGFSGIIYGVDAFLLLASKLGKRRFMGHEISLASNWQVSQTMTVLTAIGVIYSFMPGISLLGHMTGLAAGALLFLI